MKLYKISQSVNTGYDTYDASIVAAESEEDAVKIHPGDGDTESMNAGSYRYSEELGHWLRQRAASSEWTPVFDVWPSDLTKIKVELIGEASPGVKPGVVLSSFNAG